MKVIAPAVNFQEVVHPPGGNGYAGNKMHYAQNLQTQMIVARRTNVQ
jgi:hypothetical protein